MTCQHVDEVLKTPSPVLYEILLEDAVILVQEGDLLEVSLFWKNQAREEVLCFISGLMPNANLVI